MKKFLVLIILLITSDVLYSQMEVRWLTKDNFAIRKYFQDYSAASLPAELIVTLPKNEQDSYLINLALGYGIIMENMNQNATFNKRLKVSTIFEWHRNNLSSNEQNRISSGLLAEWLMFNLSHKDVSVSPFTVTKMAYNNDILNGVKSLSFNQYLSLISNSPKGSAGNYLLPQMEVAEVGKVLSYNYYFNTGFEYTNNISVEPGDVKGDYGTLLGKFTFVLKPFHDYFDERVVLQADYTYRYNIFDNINLNKNHNKIFVLSANGVILKKPLQIILGIDYAKGDDPTQSLMNQDIWTIALKLKL